jgi:hypothetical protein
VKEEAVASRQDKWITAIRPISDKKGGLVGGKKLLQNTATECLRQFPQKWFSF